MISLCISLKKIFKKNYLLLVIINNSAKNRLYMTYNISTGFNFGIILGLVVIFGF